MIWMFFKKLKKLIQLFLKIYSAFIVQKMWYFPIAQNNPYHIHGEQFVKFKHMVH
jgi:hypothetical protein